MREYIGVTLAIIGIFMVGFAQLIGIGTVLYEWSNDVQLSMALWDGFVRWVYMGLGGLVILLLGFAIKE